MDIFFDLFISFFTYQIDMPFVYECLGPLGIAALIGGSFGFAGSMASGAMATADSEAARKFAREERIRSQKWQEQMMDKQNQMQKDTAQWSYDNFESPLAQKQNMQAAGMNPFVEGSALQSGVTSAPSGPSMPSAATGPNIQPSSQKYIAMQLAADSVGKALQQYKQYQLQDQQIEQTRLQNEGIALDNVAKANNNSIFDLIAQAKQQGLISGDLANKLDAVKLKYADDFAKTDLAAKQQTVDNLKAEFDLILSNVEKNSYEYRYISAMRDRVISQIKVDESQIDLNDAKSVNLKADTDLKNYELKEIKPAQFEKLKAEIDKIDQDIKHMRRQDALKALDTLWAHIGVKPPSASSSIGAVTELLDRVARNATFANDPYYFNRIKELCKIAYQEY